MAPRSSAAAGGRHGGFEGEAEDLAWEPGVLNERGAPLWERLDIYSGVSPVDAANVAPMDSVTA